MTGKRIVIDSKREISDDSPPFIVAEVGVNYYYIAKKENVGVSIHYGRIQELIDAINELISNSTLYKTLSENGRKAFKAKYNWENMGERLLSLYRALLKQE